MITLKDLEFGYKRGDSLFSGLNAELKPGSIVGLLGRNGAGKTSLLKILAGLRFSRRGLIQVGGAVPRKRSVPFLQSLFLIPEEFQLPDVSPCQYANLNGGFYPLFNRDQYNRYCEEFDLQPDIKSSRLSMGQRKKILIAFGLAANTPLLLMDEPTNGLDIPSKSQFRKMTAAALNPERLILIATHQVLDVETLIDTVIILDNGRVIFHQSIDDIFKKLRFTLQNEEPGNGAIYFEKALRGYLVVSPNTGGEESPVQLEPLFNAVTRNTETIRALFEEAAHANS